MLSLREEPLKVADRRRRTIPVTLFYLIVILSQPHFLSLTLLFSIAPVLSISPALSIALAEDSEPNIQFLKGQLLEVQSRIKTEQNRLARLEKERDAIGSRLKELESARGQTLSQRDTTQESVVALSTEAERLKLTLFGARQQMEHQRARMHRRVVALYKSQKRSPNSEYLFQADSTTDLLKRAKYLSRVTEHDQVYISQLSQVVRRGQDDRKQLEELLRTRREKLAELTSLSERLEQQRFQTAGLLREQEAKAEQQQASLIALRLSANQLQRMLGEMMDSSQVDTAPRVSGEKVGLARVRGSLQFPVAGRIVQSFGKQRHTEFEDILFKKGLEVASEAGAIVTAVASGTVLFRQELPGFGPVIIVDHGSRYYTLYGRLADIMVNVGQRVESGDRIAITGPLDNRGRNFYFELRYQGKAENPEPYFKSLPPGV